MKEFLNKVKWCPVCNQGWVQLVKNNNDKIYLCCSECETEWEAPEKIEINNGTQGKFGDSIDMSMEEVVNIGWDKYLLEE